MTDSARATLYMDADEVTRYLEAMRRVQVATLNGDGSVHLVPMSYLVWEGQIGLWTDPRSQKVANLRRDPRITVLIEDGEQVQEFRALQVRGRAEIVDDPDRVRRAGEALFARYRPGGLDEETRSLVAAMVPVRVLVVVRGESTISWDHAKLASGGLEDIGR
jgi:PPOX class probable F420-dependent enzyme